MILLSAPSVRDRRHRNSYSPSANKYSQKENPVFETIFSLVVVCYGIHLLLGSLGKKIKETRQTGYEKGVRDAAEVCESASCTCSKDILALLNKPN